MTVSRPSLAVDCAFSVTVAASPRPATVVFGAGVGPSARADFGRSSAPPVIIVLPVTASVLASNPHDDETEAADSVIRAVKLAVARLTVDEAATASAVSVTPPVVSSPVMSASVRVTGVSPGKLATPAGGAEMGPVATAASDSFGDAASAGEMAITLRAPASASVPA